MTAMDEHRFPVQPVTNRAARTSAFTTHPLAPAVDLSQPLPVDGNLTRTAMPLAMLFRRG